MIKATCENCGHLNEAVEMNNTTFRSICDNCHTFLPLGAWKTENGLDANSALYDKTCRCGNKFKGQHWMRECRECWARRKANA